MFEILISDNKIWNFSKQAGAKKTVKKAKDAYAEARWVTYTVYMDE